MLAFFVFSLLTAAQGQPSPAYGAVPFVVVRRLSINNPLAVLDFAKGALSASPGDPNILAAAASAHSLLGNYEEATALFELGDGSDFYEVHGIHYHAAMLQSMGAYSEALALRRSMLLHADNVGNREHQSHTGEIEALRALGEYDAAIDAADFALTTGVRPAFYAAKAEVYLDQGDLDAASEMLALAEHCSKSPTFDTVMASTRYLAALGEYELAIEQLDGLRRRFHQTPAFWFALAELYRLNGEPSEAEHVLARRTIRDNDLPEKYALRARLLGGRGDTQGALEIVHDGLTQAPANALLLAVLAELAG